MANKGLTMGIQNEIQRLKNLKHSQSKISQILGISRTTVIKYWDEDFKLENIDYEPEWFKKINQDYILSEVRNGVPKSILYEELKTEVTLPSYQAFSKFFKNKINLNNNKNQISLRQKRLPGLSTEVDYSGNSVPIFTPSTGEVKNTELFVGALSYSSYIFAEFTYTQTLKDFLISHVNMFKAFGGLTKFIVVDNLKSGVTKTDVYDPEINTAYQDMCEFYGTSVDPARPYRPKDKPVVENAVGLIQRLFFPRIREKTFTSLFELNKELKDLSLTPFLLTTS